MQQSCLQTQLRCQQLRGIQPKVHCRSPSGLGARCAQDASGAVIERVAEEILKTRLVHSLFYLNQFII